MPADSVVRVEETDRIILRRLQTDGRASYADLARETGLSTSALHQRVKRLELRGVITGYSARIDHDLIDLPLTAFIALFPIDPAAPDDVPERLHGIQGIEGCWSVAGAESYLIKVRVSNPNALEVLLAQIRAAANVSTRTTVVLSTSFDDQPTVP